jgi:hypothetical protein
MVGGKVQRDIPTQRTANHKPEIHRQLPGQRPQYLIKSIDRFDRVEIFEKGLAVARQIRGNCEVALLCKKGQHEAPLQGLLPSGTRNMGRPRPPRPLYPGKDGDRLLLEKIPPFLAL